MALRYLIDEDLRGPFGVTGRRAHARRATPLNTTGGNPWGKAYHLALAELSCRHP